MEITLDSSLELGEMSAALRQGGMTLAAPRQDLGMEENSNLSWQREKEGVLEFFQPWTVGTKVCIYRPRISLAPLVVAQGLSLALRH